LNGGGVEVTLVQDEGEKKRSGLFGLFGGKGKKVMPFTTKARRTEQVAGK